MSTDKVYISPDLLEVLKENMKISTRILDENYALRKHMEAIEATKQVMPDGTSVYYLFPNQALTPR